VKIYIFRRLKEIIINKKKERMKKMFFIAILFGVLACGQQ